MNNRLGGPLVGLSMQRVSGGLFHVGGVPRVPTNTQRLQAFRAHVVPEIGNGHFCFSLGRPLSEGERYAHAECIDNRTPTTDVHYLETL